MALETATYIDALVTSNPDGLDQRNTADDHLRLIKAALRRSFPMVAGAVSASHQAITYVNDLNAPVQGQINALREGSATANNAVNAKFAASASFAWSANHAVSASEATLALTANSASYASNAGSSSFATRCTQASSASFATLAADSNALGGTGAAGYAQLDVPQSFSKGQAITQVNTSGTTHSINCDASTMFRHTLTGNTTGGTPNAPRSGQVITIHLIQGGSGSNTYNWSSVFLFAGGSAPTLSTAVGARDVFAFQYDATSARWCQAGLNVS